MKKDTRRKTLNPETGRMVFITGKKGQEIRKKRKLTKEKKTKKKATTKQTKKASDAEKRSKAHIAALKKLCKNNKCIVPCCWKGNEKKKGGPIKGKWYGERGATKQKSPMFKTAGKTKNFATRPSARALYDNGFDYKRCIVRYNNKDHKMDFRPETGSPYWREIKD